ncbi:MAG: penicillin acylase family protein, partial [Bryobacterales bacterium]|nr:penicillin acylase family protein [Bryobacterales bacterium]
YVETVNHGKPTQYLYRGEWLPMTIERELLEVKGYSAPLSIELKFTRHGPIIWEDPEHDRVVAVRWAGAEPGTAGYLGSLAMDSVSNWNEFLDAVKRWKIPPENMLYGDREGNIGWLAAGLVPQRKGWNGLLPVPGNSGNFEWDSFLPTEELPQLHNPARGFIATANHNILPEKFRYEVGFDWSAPYRYKRIEEALSAGGPFSLEDFQKLQHDETSLPGGIWQQILQANPAPANRDAALARDLILGWDRVLSRASVGGAVYSLFSRQLRHLFVSEVLPAAARPVLELRLDHRVLVQQFVALPPAKRGDLLERALSLAWQTASKEMGADPRQWAWGRLHFALFRHPLANTAARSAAFNLGPVPRGGDAFTVNATGGSGLQQTHGASYRQIIDFDDWDRSVFTSTPGQSGQPGSPHFSNLLELWGKYEYAPLLYSREQVELHAAQKLVLSPR